jgi:BlaI family transcriptional regulator, penicillinase repressor
MSVQLGKLERELMEFLWARGEVCVSDFQKHTGERLAYTTVMTTLDRLYKKGLLDRRKEGKAFFYVARQSKTEFKQGFLRRMIDAILQPDDDTRPLLASLVDTVSERDRALLDDLEKMVKAAKRKEPRP